MVDKAQTLQDLFLNTLRKAKAPVTIFLVKGVRLQGVITWFDAFSILLRREGEAQLIYKHAVSTIQPQGLTELPPVTMSETKAKPALQDHFLAAAERERQSMTLFLVNGVMLQGEVARHDQFVLLLERGGQAQLVYKHAISTLQPAQPLDLGLAESSE